MQQFPALPSPLRYLLGLRAHLLDVILRHQCHQQDHVHYVHSELNAEKAHMAVDGYHPNRLGYQEWAKNIVPQISQYLPSNNDTDNTA